MTNQENKIKDDTWLYVVVKDPEKKHETFVAFVDSKTNENYIPAFLEKEQALGWLYNLKKEDNSEYEVQAIYYDFLKEQANVNNYKIHIMNKK